MSARFIKALAIIALAFAPVAAFGDEAEIPEMSPDGGARLGDYPSPVEMYGEIYALAAEFPELVSLSEIGRTTLNRPIFAIRIGLNDGKKRPEALVAGNIHGNEYIGNRLAMGVARRLAGDYGKDPWITSLIDRVDFWIVPCINPDGYARTWELAGNGEWPIMRKNARGVDLNRNFPLYGKKWLPLEWAGSSKPENIYYKGTGVYSEPETRAIRDFTSQRAFFVAIDFHSWGGYLIPAKCPDSECVGDYKKIAAAYRSKQKHVKYRRRQMRLVDQYTGEMEDMMLYEYGALGVCVELSTTNINRARYKTEPIRFWTNNPYDFNFWIENDADASLAAIEKALEITGGKPTPPKPKK